MYAQCEALLLEARTDALGTWSRRKAKNISVHVVLHFGGVVIAPPIPVPFSSNPVEYRSYALVHALAVRCLLLGFWPTGKELASLPAL